MSEDSAILPPCAQAPEAYLDEAVGESSVASLSRSERNQLRATRARLHRQCAGCPVLFECLFRAVVEVDVSGYAACTTEADRALMRRRLGVEVTSSALTPYGAPRVGGGPVSHEAVIAARHAHPKDTCLQLAERLGCSTSTIKRHLRRERQQHAAEVERSEPRAGRRPTIEQVLDAFETLDTAATA